MQKTFVSKRAVLALAGACLLLAGCGGGRDRPADIDSGERSRTLPEPTGAARACFASLDGERIGYRRLPDRSFGRGCSALGAVQLLQVGTPTRNLGAMTCQLAYRYGRWAREVLQPAAERHFGKQVTLVDTMGTYSCRNIAGSNRVSEHGKANAIDIGGFTLEDGKRITVLAG